MTPPSNGEPDTDVADRLYAARCAVADAPAATPRVGVADLVRFLADPGGDLPWPAQRALFSDHRLRADFKRLKACLGCVELPALAAASDGTVRARTFDGGSVRIHPSRVAGQTYALFQFNWPARAPRALLLEGASGDMLKRHLPVAVGLGQAVLVLDQSKTSDDAFLRMIEDTMTTGAFIL